MSENTPDILLLEKDVALGKELKQSLETKGYHIDLEQRGDRGLQLFQARRYDLLICSVVLPGLQGLELAKTIRKSDYLTPILFVADEGDDREKIHAYCSGGDDYLIRPFSVTELALRIYALLKRSKPNLVKQELPDVIEFGNFTFDYTNRTLCNQDESMHLTKKEAEVLRMLALNINAVVKRETVLTDVWGENDYFMGRSMDVYIARLRKKLALDRNVSIVNVHRMGFKLEVTQPAS